MATVYRAYDRQSGEWCALKILLPQLAERPIIRARFAAEAEAMSRIKHRNVIHVFDVGTDAARPYFTMELAEGGCLVDWVKTHGPMPGRMASDVAIQICKGIGAAHRMGVIHRDIKPHNILVNRRGVCKITDFGIAQFEDDSASLTQTGSVMGTLGYIAPEQRASAKDVDERADIYSIGATLFTLVTARTTMDLFFADQEPDMLDGVPEPLIPVLLKATRYRREDRYSTVRALAKALYHVKNSLPEDPPGTPSIILPQDEEPGSAGLREQPTSFDSVRVEAALRATSSDDSRSTDEGASYADAGLAAVTSTLRPAPQASFPPSDVETPPGTPVALTHSLSPHSTPPTVQRERSPSLPPIPREVLLSRSPERREPLVDWGRVVRRTAAISIPLLLLLFVLSSWATVNASQIQTKQRAAFQALETWLDVLQRDDEVLKDLLSMGADAERLQGAWTALKTAEDPFQKADAAAVWVEVATLELATHAPTNVASHQYAKGREMQNRLGRLHDLRSNYVRHLREWQQTAGTTGGRFAIWMGLVPAPPQGIPQGHRDQLQP